MKKELFNFGLAIEALKQGKRVARQSWKYESKKFIFVQVPSTIGKDIVPKMQSLPTTVKHYFEETFVDPAQQISDIYYNNQIACVGLSNVIEGWNPTCNDILGEDWMILD
ncbi:MAG TPA: MW1434 family type I TA system toxin [Paludibacter sp.]